MNFQMANADNPEELIVAAQKALVASMRDVFSKMKKDIHPVPGLTWDQLEYFLNEFEKKKPTIVTQEGPM